MLSYKIKASVASVALLLSIGIACAEEGMSLDTAYKAGSDSVDLGIGSTYSSNGLAFSSMLYSSTDYDIGSIKSNVFNVKKVKLGISDETELLNNLFFTSSLQTYIDSSTGLMTHQYKGELTYYF